jgi:hypothetical protein
LETLGRAGAQLSDLMSFQPIQLSLLLQVLIFQLCSFSRNIKRIHLVGISGYLAVVEAVQNLMCLFTQLLQRKCECLSGSNSGGVRCGLPTIREVTHYSSFGALFTSGEDMQLGLWER